MTALLLDIGNSRLKWGVLDDGTIRRTGHVLQETIREQGLQVVTTRLPRRVDTVFASNVAGTSFGTRLAGVVGIHCNCDLRFAHSQRRGWGVTNGYRQPRQLGVDRWVALVGAWFEIGKACLVVDVGTAMTIDAIDDEGQHLGGQIVPGVETMFESLSTATSDLPRIKAASRQSAPDLGMFGRNTRAAIREGVQSAVAGAVERSIHTLQSSGYDPHIVLTGGGASRILGALGATALHRPNLVLQGLACMLENER